MKLWFRILSLLLILGGCGATAAPTSISPTPSPTSLQVGSLQISDVWARPVVAQRPDAAMATPTIAMSQTMTSTGAMTTTMAGGMSGTMGGANGASNGAAYMRIQNTGGVADRLLRATSAVAQVVELHTVEETDGVMAMRQVTAIDVPANDTAVLKPGGFHIMLIGVQDGLILGDTFTVTLTFEQAGSLTIPVLVKTPVSP